MAESHSECSICTSPNRHELEARWVMTKVAFDMGILKVHPLTMVLDLVGAHVRYHCDREHFRSIVKQARDSVEMAEASAMLNVMYSLAGFYEAPSPKRNWPPPVSERPRGEQKKVSMTYFIQDCGSGDIKIGRSVDVPSRLSTLQGASSTELKLLLALPESELSELDAHKRFASDRIRREWFRASDKLLAFIESNSEVRDCG